MSVELGSRRMAWRNEAVASGVIELFSVVRKARATLLLLPAAKSCSCRCREWISVQVVVGSR